MIDILYLAFNRVEFTRASLATLLANTNWEHIDRVCLYDDGSTDGTLDLLRGFGQACTVPAVLLETRTGSPVAVMNNYLSQRSPADIFIKIDSDVLLPPNWLNEGIGPFYRDSHLDLLGIEAMYPTRQGNSTCGAEPAEYIGGIGFMRTRAFHGVPLPRADGRFGFTAWQIEHPRVKKAWLNPSLPVCLLNRLPFEPWRSLSAEYVAKGWQRAWPGEYDPTKDSALWNWWKDDRITQGQERGALDSPIDSVVTSDL